MGIVKEKWKIYSEMIYQISEKVYLLIFFGLVAFSFLKTTIFPIPWAAEDSEYEYFYNYTFDLPVFVECALCVLIVLRCLTMKRFNVCYLIISLSTYTLIKYAVSINKYDNLTLWILLILGAKEVSFQKLMKIYTWTIGILLCVTVVGALSGVIDNVAFGAKEKLAFGIVSSTDFAAHVFFLFLCIWYVYGELIPVWYSIGVLITAGLVYKYSLARCSVICMVLLAVFAAWYNWIKRYYHKKNEDYAMPAIIATAMSVSIQVAAIGTHILTMLYDRDSVFFQKLNSILSNRLELGNRGISVCGFQLWGQKINLIGHWVSGRTEGKYFYLDSSYLQMSLMYGVIVTCIMLIAFSVIGYRAYCSGQWILLWMLGFVAIHGVIEQRLMSFSYCPILIALMAQLNRDKRRSCQ